MWNFSFIIPTMLILTIILSFYFSLPHLRIRKNAVFIQMIVMETLVVIFDILSSYADNNYQSLPMWLTNMLNAAFFICFLCRAYLFFIFTVSVLESTPKENMVLTVVTRIPFYLSLIIAVLSPITGWIYYMDENGYHSGPMYNMLYVVSMFYLIVSLSAIGLRASCLKSSRQKYSLILFNIILLVGIIVRKMLPTYLLMDTFCLMAIVVVYLGFENPEFYMDLRSTSFNRNAFRLFLNEHRHNTDYRYFALTIHNYNEMREIYGSSQMDNGLHMISLYLKRTFPKSQIFYFSRGRFILLGKGNYSIEHICQTVSERFTHPWFSADSELYLEANFAYYTPQDPVPDSDIIMEAFGMALGNADQKNDGVPLEIGGDELVRAEDERNIKHCFETAIEHDDITVFLQPIIDVRTKKVVGAEALARLFDQNGNIIPPGLFIPIAENSGRINDLGEQVFTKVCRFIRETDLAGSGIKWVNVNLSPLQLIRNDLSDRFAEIAESHGVSPDFLHLEITEESVIDDTLMQKQIPTLTAEGFQLVLDDYGTGYSNLTRIKKCPFINIKLDMELVWDYCKTPDEILPTMIQAFKHMGFGITAEGIEDEAMACAMEQIGVDYFQGFFYSRPVPMSEFVSTLDRFDQAEPAFATL